jgi:ethanolamine ammonia-lyase small subunit
MTDDSKGLWSPLRRLTAARIGLKRAGASLATVPLLEFRLAHARARDAVHEALDRDRLAKELAPTGLPTLLVDSEAADRQSYLMRPDLGRRVAPNALAALARHASPYDIAFVVADGLSARAVQHHAAPVLAAAAPMLRKDRLRLAPIVIVRNGRVAIGDAIAATLGAACVAVLIGERPGLTAPDSMGVYLTWRPGAATTDADRNCISNIRPDGIAYDEAAFKLVYLLRAMRARQLSGVALKDESSRLSIGQADA